MTEVINSIPLSKKQISLTQRLQQICDKINQSILPFELNRIEAFGSYIRGKANPNDIDLVVYYNDNDRLDKLYDFLKEIFQNMKFDFDSTPKQVVLQYLKDNYDKTLTDLLNPIYSNWLEGITWNHIEYGHPPYKQPLLKRLLLRGTKNIHISNILKDGEKHHMMAKESRVIWSPQKPSVMENLREILMNESEKIIASELENLKFQLEWTRFKNEILTGLFNHLLKFDIKKYDIRDIDSWLKNELKMIFPSHPDYLLEAAWQESGSTIHASISDEVLYDVFRSKISAGSQTNSVEIVRNDLKEARMEHEVIYRALVELEDWKKRDINEPFFLPAPVWVAWKTISDVPKKHVPEETIRKYLRQNNLPEEKIITDRSYGRVLYRFPDEDKVR